MIEYLKSEIVKCKGYNFKIGRGDAFGPVFMIDVDGKYYGVRTVRREGQELGFDTGVFATKDQAEAINAARELYFGGKF